MAAERAYDYVQTAPKTGAPQVESPQKQKVELKRVENEKAVQIERERAAAITAAKVAVSVCVCLVVLLFSLHSFVERQETKAELERISEEYTVVLTKNRELKAELNALVASVNIDKIAVEQLGLVKIMPEDEIYLSPSSDNKVIVFDKKQ